MPIALASDPAAAIVHVLDDNERVRRSLWRLFTSVGLKVETYSSPRDFLARYNPDLPGCLVLDVSMPGMSGIDIHETLLARGQACAIVFLTGKGDIPMSVRALKRGAVDFLTKPADNDTLIAAVHTALEKDQLERRTRAELAEIQARIETLTPREREVMAHVISGQLNKQMASDMGAAEKTIKVHRGRVMEKMKVQSVAALVHLAERVGFKPAAEQATLPPQRVEALMRPGSEMPASDHVGAAARQQPATPAWPAKKSPA